jgi:8-oxo-dGTP diphosphatase
MNARDERNPRRIRAGFFDGQIRAGCVIVTLRTRGGETPLLEAVDVAIVILVRDRELLIAQRSPGSHLAGNWEFPGGKCLPGELPEECARREAREELGVEVRIMEGWEMLEYAYDDRRVRLHPFVGEIRSGEPMALGCSEIRWVKRKDLVSYSFPEANAPLLKRLTEK